MTAIRNAAILVIGDEVLNSKIKDTNSAYFAEFCYKNGADLRRVVVVPDETEDIVSELNNLRKKYDFIVTTGGIGPTHDDITYESVAKAYNFPLKLHEKTVIAMDKLAKHPPKSKEPGSEELKAQLRMATFPSDSSVECHFVTDDLWVPIVSIQNQVYIFPGIPSLFTRLLEDLKPSIQYRFPSAKLHRHFVSTTWSESMLAPILKELQEKYKENNVKIGSYPHYCKKTNTVSILGPAESDELLKSIVQFLLDKIDDAKEISAAEESRNS